MADEFVGVIIPVAGGGNAMIDHDDYAVVSTMVWEINRNGYARHRRKGVDILLHRFVMGNPAGLLVDHRDRNRLNCRKYNLVAVPRAVNDYNRAPRGVSLDPSTGMWRVRMGGKTISRHSVETEAWAAAAQIRVDRLGEHAPPWAKEILNGKEEGSGSAGLSASRAGDEVQGVCVQV